MQEVAEGHRGGSLDIMILKQDERKKLWGGYGGSIEIETE